MRVGAALAAQFLVVYSLGSYLRGPIHLPQKQRGGSQELYAKDHSGQGLVFVLTLDIPFCSFSSTLWI